MLNKRHANHVTSLTRQLQREKLSHRSTTDMLRRTMSKIRKIEENETRQHLMVEQKKTTTNNTKEKEWNDNKEDQLHAYRKREDQTRNQLLQTRARLGAVKEEHARMLEYLRTMGITAPGGDVTNFTASRYMSGFTGGDGNHSVREGQLVRISGNDTPTGFNGSVENDMDHPQHRRTFSFSISPARKSNSSHWGASSSSSTASMSSSVLNKHRGNKPGTVPMMSTVTTPRDSNSEGGQVGAWRDNINIKHKKKSAGKSNRNRNKKGARRPASAPGRRRYGGTTGRSRTTGMTEKESTQKLLQGSMSRSGSSAHVGQSSNQSSTLGSSSVNGGGVKKKRIGMKGRKKKARPKSAMNKRSTVASSLGIGTQFYTNKY